MEDLGIKLNPLTKLRIYCEARKLMFNMLDRDAITPERLDTVMSYVKANVVHVESPIEAKKFYKLIAGMFAELAPMRKMFQNEEDEKIDRVLGALVDNLINKGEFDLAQRIMDEIKKLEEFHGKSIEEIRNEAPGAFDKAVETVKKEIRGR